MEECRLRRVESLSIRACWCFRIETRDHLHEGRKTACDGEASRQGLTRWGRPASLLESLLPPRPPMHHLLRLILGLSIACAGLPSQITVSARTSTDVAAKAGNQLQVIPANTDIRNGMTVSARESTAGAAYSASASLSLEVTPRLIRVYSTDSCSAGGFSIGQNGSGFGPYSVEVQVSSAAPVPTSITVEYCYRVGGVCSSYGSTLNIGQYSYGNRQAGFYIPPPCGPPYRANAEMNISASPTLLRVNSVGGAATGGICSVNSSGASGFFAVTMTRQLPCRIDPYGSACAGGLEAYTTWDAPGLWLEYLAAGVPASPIIVVGTTRLSIPVGPCWLLTDPAVILPLPVIGETARVHIVAPPIPGLTLCGQVFDIGPTGIRASGALQLSYP